MLASKVDDVVLALGFDGLDLGCQGRLSFMEVGLDYLELRSKLGRLSASIVPEIIFEIIHLRGKSPFTVPVSVLEILEIGLDL